MPSDHQPRRELFGSSQCRFTAELREDLLWRGVEFDEYDVDEDEAALLRMLDLTDGQRMVPVLIEDGEVTQIGIGGRGCFVSPKEAQRQRRGC